jgi:uncharacterized protein YjbJ (UPF0337 family)
LDQAQGKVKDILDQAQGKANDLIDKPFNKAQGLLDSAKEKVTGFIGGLFGKVEDKVKTLAGNVQSKASGLLDKVTGKAKDLFGGLLDKAKDKALEAVGFKPTVSTQKLGSTDKPGSISGSVTMAEFIYTGYSHQAGEGPITIVPGSLKTSSDSPPVDIYVVGMSGTDNTGKTGYDGKPLSVLEDLKIGLTDSNGRYADSVVERILATIPKGSNLVLGGHSLGGMTAQLVAADPRIKDNYNVIHTVAYGAPVMKPGDQEGGVSRLADRADVVPFLSIHTLNPLNWDDQFGDVSREYSGIIPTSRVGNTYIKSEEWSNFIDNHTAPKWLQNGHGNSYIDFNTWGDYDALGQKGGTASITFDPKDVKHYMPEKQSYEQDIKDKVADVKEKVNDIKDKGRKAVDKIIGIFGSSSRSWF